MNYPIELINSLMGKYSLDQLEALANGEAWIAELKPIGQADTTPREDHPNLGSEEYTVLECGELKKAVYCERDRKGGKGWANGDYWLYYGDDNHELYDPKHFLTFNGSSSIPEPKGE